MPGPRSCHGLTAVATLGITLALGQGARAQEAPLSGAAFEALVQGKTMNTYSETGLIGVETFLPNRRTIWRDANRCMLGTWTETDGIICYTYENDPQSPYCRAYFDRGGWLLGYKTSIWRNDAIRLYPTTDSVSCDDFLGT